MMCVFFFFKQKMAYEMRISDWSSDVCSSDLDDLARDMQTVARRLLICGMHVHVGLDDDELRMDLMQQIAYFLPPLLALSTSSPFWPGEVTGLKCYPLSVFTDLPRPGLPESFARFAASHPPLNARLPPRL